MIIGISGNIGSGKDTLGMMLQALTMPQKGRWYYDPVEYAEAYKNTPNLKSGWDIYKFADKLKEIASLLLGVPRQKFEDQEFKLSTLGPEWDNMTVRQFIQRLGTEGLRTGLHKNTWVNALFANYKQHDSNWIVTDVRFPNEFDAIKERDGFLVRILRSNNPYKQSLHESETALNKHDFDVTVDNDSTLENLLVKAKAIHTIVNLRVAL